MTLVTGDDAFDRQVQLTITFEGSGLNDSRSTTGELSRYGISLKSFPDLGEEGIINLTEDEAVRLYKTRVWDHYGFSSWPSELSGKCFDMLVNPGAGSGLRVLQGALITVGVDINDVAALKGWRDPNTLQMVKAVDLDMLHIAIRHGLTIYYTDRVAKGFLNPKYLNGLLRRALS